MTLNAGTEHLYTTYLFHYEMGLKATTVNPGSSFDNRSNEYRLASIFGYQDGQRKALPDSRRVLIKRVKRELK